MNITTKKCFKETVLKASVWLLQLGIKRDISNFDNAWYFSLKVGNYGTALKVASAIFLLVCFLSLKESTFETEKCFLFHFEGSFRSQENQILEFQVFNFHDVIKCVSIKEETLC